MDTQIETAENERKFVKDPVRRDEENFRYEFEASLALLQSGGNLTNVPQIVEKYAKMFADLKDRAEKGSRDDLMGEYGFYRKRFFQEQVIDALERIKKLKSKEKGVKSIGFALVDVDHLRKTNDTLGHPTTDKVLQEVAKRMQSTIRQTDILGRLGGDEMGVCYFNVDENDMKIATERLREAVGDTEIILPDNRHFTQTVSVGFVLAKEGDIFDTLYQQADTRLYQAKENGRNTVAGGEKGSGNV